jgi:hypothetical protein
MKGAQNEAVMRSGNLFDIDIFPLAGKFFG